jgi:hypothetical protein
MDFESLAKAGYDPETGEITGCRENTLIWHHEDRHRQQYNNSFIDNLGDITHLMLVSMSSALFISGLWLGWMMEAGTVTTLQISFSLAGITAMPYILLQVLLEIDAAVYQIRKWMEGDYIKR